MPHKDPEIRRAQSRKRQALYRARHLDRARTKERRYEQEHKEELLLKRRQYKAQHREAIARSYAAWAKANPDKTHARTIRRRARLLHARINDFTATQWQMMKKAYGYSCVYCGNVSQRLTMDHLTPLSKGGNHTLHNIVPACQSCNARKHDGPPLCPVQPLLLTVATPKTERKKD